MRDLFKLNIHSKKFLGFIQSFRHNSTSNNNESKQSNNTIIPQKFLNSTRNFKIEADLNNTKMKNDSKTNVGKSNQIKISLLKHALMRTYLKKDFKISNDEKMKQSSTLLIKKPS